MMNMNMNFGARQGGFGSMMGGGGGFPGGAQMGGFGAMGGGGFGAMGGQMMGGFGQMGQMGGNDPMMAQMNQMSQMMGLMTMAMMTLMTRLMANQVQMLGQSQFGNGLGGGNPQGSGIGNFLGSGSGGGGGAGATGGTGGSGATADTGTNAPAGSVGNVNVDKLIAAIPSGYHANARKHWPAIVKEAQAQGITNKAQLAYILATTVHESGAGKYMQEIASGSAYEGRRDLGNNQSGDGVRYKGRGYVQITGRNNYTNWGKKLGIDLVGNPSLAERPEIAAKILVGGMKEGSFTGKGLDDYINGSRTDFNGARRIVNGTDKAGTFAATAQAILRAM